MTVRRANAYLALARLFEPPGAWQESRAEMLREHFDFAGLGELALEVAGKLEAALTHPESLALAHAKLFVGPFEMQVPPYASIYLDQEQRLMGPVSMDAAEAYAEAGLGPGEGPKEVPDHLTLELEFMYYLAFQGATSGAESWAERQQRFWNEHLGRWLPELAEALVKAETLPFYRSLAVLLEEFCRREVAHHDPTLGGRETVIPKPSF
ncbi:MAG: molecular chaperone TorD family protein [Thermoanaerobaculia bacterium]